MNQQSIEIRNMVMDDIDEVLSIEGSIFSAPWSRDIYVRELQLPVSRSLVAKTYKNQNFQIAGYMTFWIIAGEVQIHKITVREDLRRSGIASALMEAMLRSSCNENATCCTLEVGRSNQGAKKLYEKFGFTITDMRPRYYSDSGDDALLMCVDLKNVCNFFKK